jgi:hypothetical protein
MNSPSSRIHAAGFAGLVAAVLVSVLAWYAPGMVTILLTTARVGVWAPRIFLLALGLVACLELPLMLLLMIQMIKRANGITLLPLVNFSYVFFPAVYALLGTMLTGQRWWVFVMLLLAFMRFISSLLAIRLPAPAPKQEEIISG